MKNLHSFINPVAFYSLVLIHNYIIKTGAPMLICSTTFIPALIYTLSVIHTINKKLISFSTLFFGILFGLIDFICIYMYFIAMKQYSSFMILSMTIFVVFIVDKHKQALDRFVNCATFFAFILVFSLFRDSLSYELFGEEDFYMELKTVSSQSTEFLMLMFLLYAARLFLPKNAFSENERPILKKMSVLFFLIFSGLYIFIDLPNTSKEGIYSTDHAYTTLAISLLSTVWIFTTDNLSSQSCLAYMSVCTAILIFYLFFPTTKIFNITRLDYSSIPIHIILLGLLILLIIFVYYYKIPHTDLTDETLGGNLAENALNDSRISNSLLSTFAL